MSTNMKIQPIAHSYWRLVKAGRRTFESISAESKFGNPPMRDQVLYLAVTDVQKGVITAEEFEEYTGLVYEDVIANMEG